MVQITDATFKTTTQAEAALAEPMLVDPLPPSANHSVNGRTEHHQAAANSTQSIAVRRQDLLKRVKVSAFDEMCDGDTWYLLSRTYVERLEEMLHSKHALSDGGDTNPEMVVDNTALLDEHGSLAEGLNENADYMFVPSTEWARLVQEFGIVNESHVIARHTARNKQGEYVVEVSPFTLHVRWVFGGEYAANNDEEHNKLTLHVSKYHNILKLYVLVQEEIQRTVGHKKRMLRGHHPPADGLHVETAANRRVRLYKELNQTQNGHGQFDRVPTGINHETIGGGMLIDLLGNNDHIVLDCPDTLGTYAIQDKDIIETDDGDEQDADADGLSLVDQSMVIPISPLKPSAAAGDCPANGVQSANGTALFGTSSIPPPAPVYTPLTSVNTHPPDPYPSASANGQSTSAIPPLVLSDTLAGKRSGESMMAVSQRKTYTPGLCGLQNLGNTCFMNSGLQCLSNVIPLAEYFLEGAHKLEVNETNRLGTGGRLARIFGSLICKLWSGNCDYFVPRDLKSIMGDIHEDFCGYRQHDSQELLSFILDRLHEDLNRVKLRPKMESLTDEQEAALSMLPAQEQAVQAWARHKQLNDSVVVDLFHGQLKSTLHCPLCERISITYDPFLFLSTPMPQRQRFATVDILIIPNEPQMPYEKVQVRYQTERGGNSWSNTYTAPASRVVAELRIKLQIHRDIQIELIAYSATDARVLVVDPKMAMDRLSNNANFRDMQFLAWIVPKVEPQPISEQQDEQGNQENGLTTRSAVTKNSRQKRVTVLAVQYYGDRDNVEQTPNEMLGLPFVFSVPFTKACASYEALRKRLIPLIRSQYSSCVKRPVVHMESESEPQSESDISKSVDDSEAADIDTEQTQYTHNDTDTDTTAVVEDDTQSAAVTSTSASTTNVTACGSSTWMDKNENMDENMEKESVEVELPDIGGSAPAENGIATAAIEADATSGDETADDQEMNTVDDETSIDEDEQNGNDVHVQELPFDLMFVKDLNLIAEGWLSNWNTEWKPQVWGLNDKNKRATLKLHRLAEMPLSGEPVACLAVRWHPGTDTKQLTEITQDELHIAESLDGEREADPVVSNTKKTTSLDDCLRLFLKQETLGAEDTWYCNKCKDHVRAQKKFDLVRLPKILIIHLKRFSSSTWSRDKIDALVDCPINNLDMSEYLSADASSEERENAVYDLVAISNHMGGLGGGHYTAYARNKHTRNWHDFDDSYVRKMDEDTIMSRSAYVLFYERREAHAQGQHSAPDPVQS